MKWAQCVSTEFQGDWNWIMQPKFIIFTITVPKEVKRETVNQVNHARNTEYPISLSRGALRFLRNRFLDCYSMWSYFKIVISTLKIDWFYFIWNQRGSNSNENVFMKPSWNHGVYVNPSEAPVSCYTATYSIHVVASNLSAESSNVDTFLFSCSTNIFINNDLNLL